MLTKQQDVVELFGWHSAHVSEIATGQLKGPCISGGRGAIERNGMEIIDNINRLLGDDLKQSILPGAKLRIAASCFSIYAFEALKAELESDRLPPVHLHGANLRSERSHRQGPKGTPRVPHPQA